MRTSLLVLATLALTACASDDTTTVETPSGSTVTSSPDGVVTTGPTREAPGEALPADEADDLIEDAFERDPDLARFDLDASDENARVQLTGTVETEAQRTVAGALAERTAPGVPIDNLITVGR